MNQRLQQLNALHSRRRFLRGLGVSIAVPLLESLRPLAGQGALAHAADDAGSRLATTAGGAPLRVAHIYFPNGAIPENWWPEGSPGEKYQLSKTLEPLADLRGQFQILSGLECRAADPGPDGGGDHARAGGSFLTGVRSRKSQSNIQSGVSIDQVIAKQVGHLTPLPSLELSCDAVHRTGSCDSGYACAYSYNLSWSSPTSPVAAEVNPRLAFERMFGIGAASAGKQTLEQRRAQRKSVLDFVIDDARSLDRSLAREDRDKLDGYLSSLREVERRIQTAESRPQPDAGSSPRMPRGIPTDYQEHVGLMFDMLVLAFQADQTRVATLMLAHEGSNRPMPFLGIAEGHHELSHHNNKAEAIEKVKQIDRWYVQQFSAFLRKLSELRDSDGTSLLHNSMVLYGSGISDGNRHWHTNLPIVLAGSGGGTLTPNRYHSVGVQPVTNLYLGLADRMGCRGVTSHGDSTGPLAGL
jgi:hypothetical protein